MLDPRTAAESILGPVHWETSTSGFCHCPGQAHHTSKSGKKDCRISLDGVPTIFCFHDHCSQAVDLANRRLRDALGRDDWVLVMPGGAELRSGDRLLHGTIKPRVRLDERGERIAREITARYQTIMEQFRWPFEEMRNNCPVDLRGYTPEDHFRHWLLLWPPEAVIWIGEVTDSGRPESATHFRPVSEWYDIGPSMGHFTCGARFQPGTFSRSDQNIFQREFLVVESDELSKDDVGAVFRWLQRWCNVPLHCVVDTAGKSLHGWFSLPPPEKEPQLKAALSALRCDMKLFNKSQPVRLPGAWRDQKLQQLVWVAK